MKHFDKKKFSALCKTEYCGKKILYFKSISSTNEHAVKLEDKAVKLKKTDVFLKNLNGTLIISEVQSKGRGRNHKSWFSPPGGLWFTLILVLKLKPSDIDKANMIMAISILEVLKNKYGINIKIKWPNDLYYENHKKHNKVCGILSELNCHKSASFLNIGAGLNANNTFVNLSEKENNLISNAISLKEILKRDIDREHILANIMENFEKNYDRYLQFHDLKSIFSKIENSISI
ncbi:MAG: biotin--[acetyl-CoA-carboxylase] ligase [Actinomycetota bacterium]|nr:biotin--[acetyl-CoA-carboxylase] ligase [Actinomycetota bacterium]